MSRAAASYSFKVENGWRRNGQKEFVPGCPLPSKEATHTLTVSTLRQGSSIRECIGQPGTAISHVMVGSALLHPSKNHTPVDLDL